MTTVSLAHQRELLPGKPLTAIERNVLVLVTEGLTNPQIGAHLYLTESTVRTHVRRIMLKLGVEGRPSGRVELVVLAFRTGLVSCPCGCRCGGTGDAGDAGDADGSVAA